MFACETKKVTELAVDTLYQGELSVEEPSLEGAAMDRAYGLEKVAITIIRRVADPGDYHRGLTNALQLEKAPTHQAVSLLSCRSCRPMK